MNSRRNFAKKAALAATVGVSSIAGCAGGTGSETETSDSGSGGSSGGSSGESDELSYSGPIPTDIVESAQGDDTATIYGATGSSQAVELMDAFGEAISFASAEYVQMGDSGIASRLTSELRSGNVTADGTISSGRGALASLQTQSDAIRPNPDYLLDFFEEMGYPENGYGEYYYPFNVFPIVTYYNTDRISAEELPDSYLGMTEDRFDGEIVMETPAIMGGMDAFWATLHAEWGEEKFEEWAQGLLDNNVQLTDSGGTAYAELANGNNMIGFGLIDDLVRARQDGEPSADIAWDMMNPHATELVFPGVLVNESPNPAMGELFAAYCATREGQELIASWGAFPALPEVKQEAFPDLLPDDFSFETGVFNVDDYYQNTEEWREYYVDLGYGL
jgi:ABC-type Fe3+ transport system substrate-binding protein